MTQVIFASLVLVTALASLYGWGALVRRLAKTGPGTPAVTVSLGLAAVLFLGGVLNVARWAVPPALLVIVLAGLGLCLLDVRTLHMGRLGGPSAVEASLAGLFIASVVWLTIATQLPPRAFNFHDDFQKYFAHPVRMLETGTLFGSPLSSLGSETLGGMAFLQGFSLSAFPIEFINGVDAVFGFLLLLLLGAAAGWGRLRPWPGALLVPLAIAVVNPQYVNVSALFTAAALMAGAVLLVADPRAAATPSPLAVGLIYGGLVALKPTFALFVALHLPLSATLVAATRSSVRTGVRWALGASAWVALSLAPWLLLHAVHYLNSHPSPPVGDFGPAPVDGLRLFATAPLVWGATFAHYTAFAGLGLLAALWSAAAGVRTASAESLRMRLGVLAGGTTAFLAYLFLLAAAPLLAGTHYSLRYSIPFLLGTVPFAAVLPANGAGAGPGHFGRRIPAAALCFCAAAFVPSWLSSTRQAVRYGSILAFSSLAERPDYLEYNREALSSARAERIRDIQAKVPPGEPILAWIATPFRLDYRRNPIVDVEPAGLTTPWARVPRLRYVIWEPSGYGMKTRGALVSDAKGPGVHERAIGARAVAFGDALGRASRAGEVLHQDGPFLLFRLTPPGPPPN